MVELEGKLPTHVVVSRWAKGWKFELDYTHQVRVIILLHNNTDADGQPRAGPQIVREDEETRYQRLELPSHGMIHMKNNAIRGSCNRAK